MKEYVIDANGMDEKELNRTIKEQAKYHEKLIIDNPDSKHNICAGLTEEVEIEINGSAGYFVGTMAHGPRIHITGNAGWFAGDNMTEGELIIEGTALNGDVLMVLSFKGIAVDADTARMAVFQPAVVIDLTVFNGQVLNKARFAPV